jgi:serine phosphatase RsbU (regulator of sigma subunit)
LERVVSQVTVLVPFEDWHCVREERQLFPGDVLVLYIDGVTESFNVSSEESG